MFKRTIKAQLKKAMNYSAVWQGKPKLTVQHGCSAPLWKALAKVIADGESFAKSSFTLPEQRIGTFFTGYPKKPLRFGSALVLHSDIVFSCLSTTGNLSVAFDFCFDFS